VARTIRQGGAPPNRRGRGGIFQFLLVALLGFIMWLFTWLRIGGEGLMKFFGAGPGDTVAESRPLRAHGSEPESPNSPLSFLGTPSGSFKPPVEVTAEVSQAAGAPEERAVSLKFVSSRKRTAPLRVEVVPAARPAVPREPFEVPATESRVDVGRFKSDETILVRVRQQDGPTFGDNFVVKEGERALDLRGEALIVGRAAFSDASSAGNREIQARLSSVQHPIELRTFSTRSDGTFEFPALAGTNVVLELRIQGQAAGEDFATVEFRRDLLEAGKPWSLVPDPVVFEHGVTLAEGVVLDSRGSPAAGVAVRALPTGLENRVLSARTRPDGRFEITGPASVESFEVFASTETEAARAGATVKRGSRDVQLKLARPSRIHGTVSSTLPGLNPLLRVELRTDGGSVFTTTSISADGAFSFPHVPSGNWGLVVAAPDSRPDPVPVEVADAGGDVMVRDLPVRTALTTATLHVTDASGASVPGARVEVAINLNASARAVTDASGQANVIVLPQGETPLEVNAPGFATHRELWDGRRVVVLSPAEGNAASAPATRPQ
jgi:Carboxypeptidase regulatory-like domain